MVTLRVTIRLWHAPDGLLGKGYMGALEPIRRSLVYPALIRAIRREWPRYT